MGKCHSNSKQRLLPEPEETFLPCRPVSDSEMRTTQKARLQLQVQRQEGLLRGHGMRDGDVPFGMRCGRRSDYHHQAGVGYHCTRATVDEGQQLRSRAWRCPTPTAAAADGGEQHAAPAPDTPPGPLCFLQVRRRHPEKELGQESAACMDGTCTAAFRSNLCLLFFSPGAGRRSDLRPRCNGRKQQMAGGREETRRRGPRAVLAVALLNAGLWVLRQQGRGRQRPAQQPRQLRFLPVDGFCWSRGPRLLGTARRARQDQLGPLTVHAHVHLEPEPELLG
jgi:hypothetical protein